MGSKPVKLKNLREFYGDNVGAFGKRPRRSIDHSTEKWAFTESPYRAKPQVVKSFEQSL